MSKVEYSQDIKIDFDGEILSEMYKTDFFKVAKSVLEMDELPYLVKSTHFTYNSDGFPDQFRPVSVKGLKELLGQKEPCVGMESVINLPNLPYDIPGPRVFSIISPEANALFVGRFKVLKENIIHFVPTRLDTGVPVQTDIMELTRQQVQLPQFGNILAAAHDITAEIFITDLVRDPKIELQRALYEKTLLTVPRTQLNVHHVQSLDPNNPFGRYPADANNLKLEGIDPHQCKILIFCDPYASDMQLFKALEEHISAIGKLNGGKHNIEHLVVFAPLATLEGTAILSYKAAEFGVRTTIFTSSALLHARSPEMYWCPPFKYMDNLVTDPKLLRIIETAEGHDFAYILDRWCNWAAKRLSPRQAYIDSDEMELNKLGTNNIEFLNRAQVITPEVIRNIGLNPVDFISRATLEEAVILNSANQLEEFLKV